MAIFQLFSSENFDIYPLQTVTGLNLPLMEGVQAGFPSPAADFVDNSIDLNRHLIRHPSATFLARAKGVSMIKAGISDNDLLVVDKSLDPSDGKIALCYIDGEFTVKYIRISEQEVWLDPANDNFPSIRFKDGNNLMIWGIVTFIIKQV